MAELKNLRLRIKGIKSTQKITSAMKMVAAAKLRKAQHQGQVAERYVTRLNSILNTLLQEWPDFDTPPVLLVGRPDIPIELILVVTSDRGLCGGFNTNIVREVKNRIRSREQQGIRVKLFCVGHKGYELLERDYKQQIVAIESELGKSAIQFPQVMSRRVIRMLEEGEIGTLSAICSVFKSPLYQEVTHRSLVPFKSHSLVENLMSEYEPDHLNLVLSLLSQNLASQIYQILLETSISEHAARMTAMDSATRNAKDVIQGLQLTYNRTRQAVITKELIEIISGAEAL